MPTISVMFKVALKANTSFDSIKERHQEAAVKFRNNRGTLFSTALERLRAGQQYGFARTSPSIFGY